MGKRMPTTDEWVQGALGALRAAPKRRFVSTIAGNIPVHAPGERIIWLPNGAKIRVVENPETDAAGPGNQIEQKDDKLHAVVRPKTVQINVNRQE